MSMNEKWAASIGGQVEFDIELFEMTEEERVSLYGDDPVAGLREMSEEDRVARYGRSYNEYLD